MKKIIVLLAMMVLISACSIMPSITDQEMSAISEKSFMEIDKDKVVSASIKALTLIDPLNSGSLNYDGSILTLIRYTSNDIGAFNSSTRYLFEMTFNQEGKNTKVVTRISSFTSGYAHSTNKNIWTYGEPYNLLYSRILSLINKTEWETCEDAINRISDDSLVDPLCFQSNDSVPYGVIHSDNGKKKLEIQNRLRGKSNL
jgi:hypothetical protein